MCPQEWKIIPCILVCGNSHTCVTVLSSVTNYHLLPQLNFLSSHMYMDKRSEKLCCLGLSSSLDFPDRISRPNMWLNIFKARKVCSACLTRALFWSNILLQYPSDKQYYLLWNHWVYSFCHLWFLTTFVSSVYLICRQWNSMVHVHQLLPSLLYITLSTLMLLRTLSMDVRSITFLVLVATWM